MTKLAQVSRLAEALTGVAVTHLAHWYDGAEAVREMADRSTVTAEADRHPHPLAEAIRWQACEGELLQIIGRARAVNRTAADPVDVLILTDAPLPIPLDGTLAAADLTPDLTEMMLTEGGIVFENPTDAAAAYSALWDNREAAKKALS